MTTRNTLIGKVHALAKQLDYDEATYRTVLLSQTGKTSCREMSFEQLSRLADCLERLIQGKALPEGAQVDRAKGLARGAPMPTERQWTALEGLARRASWSGLKDFRLLAFARHTVKVADLGEMTRAEASKVITGLTRMLAQSSAKELQK
ncbi:MAG TPA: DUF1018 domain-containing protein [Rhodocyclaceae bacterium]|nr:DUF1018 domain-containing protein [Rhodocyclaceae bacterium]